MKSKLFINEIKQGYSKNQASLQLGAGILSGQVYSQAAVDIPMKTLNRHGLIAGATGTGKTKTIQLLAEKLAMQGVPSLLMDLKGDLSGLAAKALSNPSITDRVDKIQCDYLPYNYSVEFLSLSEQSGVKLRATVSEFGPLLFSKMLGLNSTQEGVVALIFKICDDLNMPLLDLKDFKKILNYTINEGKKELADYGRISKASASTILRKIIQLEQQGADQFFGEPSFDVEDLCGIDENGLGVISILRLNDIQDRPQLFSSFMLCLLAEIYNTFPEEGDLEQPKLMIFIDEAHLLFKSASKELVSQIENIVKLIRSKGIGIIFCTQSPGDIPDAVLSQLGLKVQHALRAFTAKDRKAIKLVAENYPSSDYYDMKSLLTEMGIGVAAITALDNNGRPTPLVQTFLCPPQSQMGPLTADELTQKIAASSLVKKHNQSIDRESAYEILGEKLERASVQAQEQEPLPEKARKTKSPDNIIESLSKNTMVRQVGRTLMRELSRGLLGVLTGSKSRK